MSNRTDTEREVAERRIEPFRNLRDYNRPKPGMIPDPGLAIVIVVLFVIAISGAAALFIRSL